MFAFLRLYDKVDLAARKRAHSESGFAQKYVFTKVYDGTYDYLSMNVLPAILFLETSRCFKICLPLYYAYSGLHDHATVSGYET